MNEQLTHASFFSGAGGTDLGLEAAGWQTVSFSEIEPYACAVLAERWPGIPNLGDIVALRDAAAVEAATQVGAGADDLGLGRDGGGLRPRLPGRGRAGDADGLGLGGPAEPADLLGRGAGPGAGGQLGQMGGAQRPGGRDPAGLGQLEGVDPDGSSSWGAGDQLGPDGADPARLHDDRLGAGSADNGVGSDVRRQHASGAGDGRDTAWQRATLWSGGFPCQDLSVAGKRRGLAGARSGLAFAFLDLVERYRPPAILLENVPGLLSSHAGRDLGALARRLGELGYGWAYRVLDAQYFGVPQRRRRVFILGLRVGPDDPLGRIAAERAAEVLSVGTRCRRHPATGWQEGEGAAPGAGDGSGVAGAVLGREGKGVGHNYPDDHLAVGSLTGSGIDKHATQNARAGHFVADVAGTLSHGGKHAGVGAPDGHEAFTGRLIAAPDDGADLARALTSSQRRDNDSEQSFVVGADERGGVSRAVHTSIGRRSGPAGDEVADLVVAPAVGPGSDGPAGPDPLDVGEQDRRGPGRADGAGPAGSDSVPYVGLWGGGGRDGLDAPSLGREAEQPALGSNRGPDGSPADPARVRAADGLARWPHDSPQLATGLRASDGHHGFSSPRGDGGDNLITDSGTNQAAALRANEGGRIGLRGDGSDNLVAYAIEPEPGQGADLIAREVEVSPALGSSQLEQSTDRGVRVVEPFRKATKAHDADDWERWEPAEQADAIAAGGGTSSATLAVQAFEPRYFGADPERAPGGAPSDVAGPIKATDGKAGDAAQHVLGFTLHGRAEGNVPEPFEGVTPAIRGADGGSTQPFITELAPALRVGPARIEDGGPGDTVPVIPIDLRQSSRGERMTPGQSGGPPGTGVGEAGDPSFSVSSRGQAVAIPISGDALRGSGAARTPSADAEGRVRLRDPGLGVGEDGDPAYSVTATDPGAILAPTLTSPPVEEGGRRDTVPAVVVDPQPSPEDELLPMGLDSHRYRCCGNGVVAPVAEWIGARLAGVFSDSPGGVV